MEEVLNPFLKTRNPTKLNNNNSEKQLQGLHYSFQNTTQTMESQTKEIQESFTALNEKLQKSIRERIQEDVAISARKKPILTNLVISNQGDTSIVETVSSNLNYKDKSQFS